MERTTEAYSLLWILAKFAETYAVANIAPAPYLGASNELRVSGFRLGAIRPSLSDGLPPKHWLFGDFDKEPSGVWTAPDTTAFDEAHQSARARIGEMLSSGELVLKSVGKGKDIDFSHVPRFHSKYRGRASRVVVSHNVEFGDIVLYLHGSNFIHVLGAVGKGNEYILVCTGWI